MSVRGVLAIVLHAHSFPPAADADALTRHLQYFTDVFLPLRRLLRGLQAGGINPNIALALTPSLCGSMENEDLMERCRLRLRELLKESQAGLERRSLEDRAEELERSRPDPFEIWRALRDRGALELLMPTATNAILPLLDHPRAMRSQLLAARRDYQLRWRRPPQGAWLAECAYDRRVGDVLGGLDLRYFFLEWRAVAFARPKPRGGVFAPVRLANGVCAFGRNPELGEELARYSLAPGAGRISPEEALKRAERRAERFLRFCAAAVERRRTSDHPRPTLTVFSPAAVYGAAPFDGPAFLERLIRKAAAPDSPVELRSPGRVLDDAAGPETVEPEPSSSGRRGYFEEWLEEAQSWRIPHIHGLTEKMMELAERFGPGGGAFASPLEERALNQCAREILLLQACDATPRAFERHGLNFLSLEDQLLRRSVSEDRLAQLQTETVIFPDVDFRIFAS